MKFDAARVTGMIEELAGPAYRGHDREAKVSAFVAQQVTRIGMATEHRQVVGSPFPRRAAPLVGWLVYGALITAGFVLFLGNDPFGMILLSLVSLAWLVAVLRNRIRVGRRRPPLETAPLLIASIPGDSSPPVRVVFQSVLTGFKGDFFQSFHLNRKRIALGLHIGLLLTTSAKLADPSAGIPLLSLGLLLFGCVWIEIAGVLYWEYARSRSVDRSQTDLRGIAVLLETARCWPRNRSSQVEAVFVVAGGQRLDYAGSREFVRLLEREWSLKPTLLVLFFAPGAGQELVVFEGKEDHSGLEKLVDQAAKSLWIPIRRTQPWAVGPLWPIKTATPTVAIIGSDLNVLADATVDPQLLQRAIQLSSEIALRWAKNYRMSANP